MSRTTACNARDVYVCSTATMPSLAERTRISAQETTSGHSLSTASLMVSKYLKFLKPKLLSVSFSDKVLLVVSNRSDASHDYTHTTHKHIYIYISTLTIIWTLFLPEIIKMKVFNVHLNSTIMENISEPREGSVLMAFIEKLDLFCYNVLSLRTRVFVEVHHKAWFFISILILS